MRRKLERELRVMILGGLTLPHRPAAPLTPHQG